MLNRRRFIINSLTTGLSFAVGLLHSAKTFAAWPNELFADRQFDSSLRHLFGDSNITPSKKISLKLPRIAENGTVVPITVSSSMENVSNIFILVEKNPAPLVAMFELMPGTDPFVSGRIKMAETCDVIAIVKSGDSLYSARKKVKVTIGGCGG